MQHGVTHRWAREAMPLKVFVSDGRTLPPSLANCVMKSDQYQLATAMLQSGSPLQVTPSYRPAFRQSVLAGLRCWDWAAKQGIVSYTVTNSARDADIVILFVEHCQEGKDGYSLFPYVSHQPCIIQLSCAAEERRPADFIGESMIYITTHEFGHCLGLEHSLFPADIMWGGVGGSEADHEAQSKVTGCSNNDCAALRALYSMPGDFEFGGHSQ